MKNTQIPSQDTVQLYSTDVLSEPIALNGFKLLYSIISWPPHDGEPLPSVVSMDFLADDETMKVIEGEAKRLISASRYSNAKWETTPDGSGASWSVGEALGPRRLITDLAVFAEKKGFTRLPFPH